MYTHKLLVKKEVSMESISSKNTVLAQHTPAATTASAIVSTPEKITATIPETGKQLQPDKVVLSAEGKAKSTEAEEKEGEDKKSIDASSLNNMTAEEAAAAEKASESDLDKEIRELSMKVLELSVKIQLLQDKEDKESVKERRILEVDLAITKGQLEAAMDRKLKLAAVS